MSWIDNYRKEMEQENIELKESEPEKTEHFVEVGIGEGVMEMNLDDLRAGLDIQQQGKRLIIERKVDDFFYELKLLKEGFVKEGIENKEEQYDLMDLYFRS